jgi:hypothetical protein
MPLLDHFHAPLKDRRHWEAFHGRWAAAMADALNDGLLPEHYFAEFQVQVGSSVEVDVATFEEGDGESVPRSNGPATALASMAWAPPKARARMPALFPDSIEVQVFATEAGPSLVGAVELVSPANKDRAEARRLFAAKCAAYLQRGIGLVVVDVVTSRKANLHDELIRLLEKPEKFAFPSPTPLYAAAYRPTRTRKGDHIDLWFDPLGVGHSLPTMPLAVRGLGSLPLDLDATYTEARRRCRLG